MVEGHPSWDHGLRPEDLWGEDSQELGASPVGRVYMDYSLS